LNADVQVISSTSGRCEWWFAVLWMVVDGAVASRRLSEDMLRMSMEL
jgi:hypothetical protein